MKISGFSFVRNGFAYDYPFCESLRSMLPLVDELVVAVGRSDDGTREAIQLLQDPRIRIIDTVWDDTLRAGGRVLADQTNLALEAVTGDWAVYLQADEILHENDLTPLRASLQAHIDDPNVEGLLFDYIHFYGSHRYVGTSRRWYRSEVRAVKTGIGVGSWGDAQGFRRQGKKLQVKKSGARIFHYGWVRSPVVQQRKLRSFHKLWHSDGWVDTHVGQAEDFPYRDGGRLLLFTDAHPAVMKGRVASEGWSFEYNAAGIRVPFRVQALDWLESLTGYRLGEYKNYRLI